MQNFKWSFRLVPLYERGRENASHAAVIAKL